VGIFCGASGFDWSIRCGFWLFCCLQPVPVIVNGLAAWKVKVGGTLKVLVFHLSDCILVLFGVFCCFFLAGFSFNFRLLFLFFFFILVLAFPCFLFGLFALPLCGAAPTFLCRRKEK
jgi:hypothetical protein